MKLFDIIENDVHEMITFVKEVEMKTFQINCSRRIYGQIQEELDDLRKTSLVTSSMGDLIHQYAKPYITSIQFPFNALVHFTVDKRPGYSIVEIIKPPASC